MKLVSVSEAAREKGISREAIYQAVQQGRLRYRRVLGRIGISRISLNAYEPNTKKIHAGQMRARRVAACRESQLEK